MRYRKLGKEGWDISILGFGCMRLPIKKIDNGDVINEEEAIRLIRHGIDKGINYIDTAWPYHGGESEVVVGKALQDGYRERVRLVTKSPVWDLNTAEDFHDILDKQLEKLQTDHLDIYLLHALNSSSFEKVKQLKLVEQAEKAQKQGKIIKLGFSFHDSFNTFKEIIDYHNWDVAQVQFNYVDTDFQATSKGLEYAASKNVKIIVMEPLRGGVLAAHTAATAEILRDSKNKLADFALRFVWNRPEVLVVLSGMNEQFQIDENIDSADKARINSLSAKEMNTIQQLRAEFKKKNLIPCTMCSYCVPCPQGVAIPHNFRWINAISWTPELQNRVKFFYNQFAKTPEDLKDKSKIGAASLCIQCGECLPKCPQGIQIPDELEKVNAVFEKGEKIEDLWKIT
jgi:predicted aldo/keto reductase-like oxidoreductase